MPRDGEPGEAPDAAPRQRWRLVLARDVDRTGARRARAGRRLGRGARRDRAAGLSTGRAQPARIAFGAPLPVGMALERRAGRPRADRAAARLGACARRSTGTRRPAGVSSACMTSGSGRRRWPARSRQPTTGSRSTAGRRRGRARMPSGPCSTASDRCHAERAEGRRRAWPTTCDRCWPMLAVAEPGPPVVVRARTRFDPPWHGTPRGGRRGARRGGRCDRLVAVDRPRAAPPARRPRPEAPVR